MSNKKYEYPEHAGDFSGTVRDGTLDAGTVRRFRKLILNYYRENGRKLPWREDPSPYNVFVSEVMLQQTQAERVVEKYTLFVRDFPGFRELAGAPLERVLALWKGLGYNRRALSIKKSADIICSDHNGILPNSHEALVSFPGIGTATASSIRAFAFNEPVVFIETNIRSVFIHFFYGDAERLADRDIMPLVKCTLDVKNPGRWYNALMDYGVMIKRVHGNPSKRSRHYSKQTPFRDSWRQMRGRVLELVLKSPGLNADELETRSGSRKFNIRDVVVELEREGFLETRNGRIYIK